MGQLAPYTPQLFAALVAGAALVYVWLRKDFVIRVRDGRCVCTGRLPQALHGRIAEFLLHDLPVRGPVTIGGTRRGDRLRLSFRGPLTAGEQQRIRNFLLSHR
jgi:hypothetical protein